MVKNSSEHGATHRLALLGAALLTVFCVATALVGGVTASVTGFQVGYLTGFAGYGLILLSLRRRATPVSSREWFLWLALCLSLRAVLIPLAPSDDVNRYIWEGLVQEAGFGPYTIPPDDPRLAGIDDALRTRVNHPHFPAIYPPLAQLTFRAAATISPTPLCFKLMHVTWDMITVLLLPGAIANGLGTCARRASATDRAPANLPPHPSTPIDVSACCPRALTLIYALCPLTLTAFAMEGHVDSLMLMLLVATLRLQPTEPPATAFAISRSAIAAGAILGCAISAKAVAILLLPWLLIRRPMIAAIALASAALWHVPFHDSSLAPFRNLARFSQYGEVFSIAQLLSTFRSDHFAPDANGLDAPLSDTARAARFDVAPKTIRLLGGSILGIIVTWSAIRSRSLALHAHRSLTALLIVSPIVHAWYWTWLVVLAPFHRARWPLVAAAACVLYYEAFRPLVSGGAWQVPLWATAAFWLVVSVFLAGKLLERLIPSRE